MERDRIPDELLFAATHQWVRLENDGTAYVGISHYPQDMVGDLLVHLPTVGQTVSVSDVAGDLEWDKAVVELNAPVSGEIIAVNEALNDNLDLINQDCYGEGWIYQIKLANKADLEELMRAELYHTFIIACKALSE